jgi:hypothetical protein
VQLTQWDTGFEIYLDNAEFIPGDPQHPDRILLGHYDLWELARALFKFCRNPMKLGRVRIRVDWLEQE